MKLRAQQGDPVHAPGAIRRSWGAPSPRRRALRLLGAPGCTVLLLAGCERPQEPTPAATPSSSAAPRPPSAPLARDRRVRIPSGEFLSGTVPGTHGRLPQVEPRTAKVQLGTFQIDRLPYPNDPDQSPLLGASRERATILCSQAGGRLCTELEWERACKGENDDASAGGDQWRCTSERECISGFDVVGLGWRREWTASDVLPTTQEGKRRPALRGSSADTPAAERRCARRRPLEPKDDLADVGFRCCYGPPNAARVTEPTEGQTFEKIDVPLERLAELLEGHPATAPHATELIYFRDPEAAETVVARGPGDRKGFSFTTVPLLWNPVAGARFLIVTARSGKDTSFVVAFHEIAEGQYSLAASFVMKHEPGPVALAYSGYIRPRLHFSTCWGCPGETGKLLYRDPDRVRISQP